MGQKVNPIGLRLGINRTFKLLWGILIPMEPVGTRTAWYGATLRMGTVPTF